METGFVAGCRRFVQWFAAVYFAAYALPDALTPLPGAEWLLGLHSAAMEQLIPALSRKFLGIEIEHFPAGSGDTTFNWLQVALLAACCAAASAAIAMRGSRPESHPRVALAVHTAVRFALANMMVAYGVAKVFPMQFGPPTLDRLAQPFGDASPMGLIWTAMGYSRPYQIFGGFAEVAAGVLLLHRRTAPAGALVCAAVMANVVALNFCYDIPVKLFSSHLLAMALWLILPEARRLWRAVLLGGEAPARPAPQGCATPRRRRAFAALEVGLAAALAHATWAEVASFREEAVAYATPKNLAGEYRAADSTEGPARRCVRVAIGEGRGAYFAYADGTGERARLQFGDDATTMTARYVGRDPEDFAIRESACGLVLESGGRRIELHRLPPTERLLLSRGFRWINEVSFNR